ncbi:unnamed protein product [Rotaria sp. Silwood1]|nr:unnamed protein product [Rotaria sp. Silwood1]CAF1369420.1 unnamed protein product [Rotaria sp. Silwood1]CAF1373760.1 unnamed protein product [Rotaria sp. Silwood1]
MFNITNPKNVQLASLPQEKLFDYEEDFGQKQYHKCGRLGDKMEEMDGTLISTFLHGRTSKDQVLRIKSKQSLTSNQVLEAAQLLIDLKVTYLPLDKPWAANILTLDTVTEDKVHNLFLRKHYRTFTALIANFLPKIENLRTKEIREGIVQKPTTILKHFTMEEKVIDDKKHIKLNTV